MIGIGWYNENGWNYKTFITKDLTLKEEENILIQFSNFIKSKNNPKLYYWSAEKQIYNKKKLSLNETLNWCDLLKLFLNEPIVLKDCFNYKLKNIANTMYKNNMIDTVLESNCNSGLNSMIQINDYFTFKDENILKDVLKYNEFDCKVLWEIVNYLRQNHS